MKFGVVSDTHNRLDHITEAIRLLREMGAELLIHCGDISSPAALRLFAPVPTHFVFGNWDRPDVLRPVATEIGAVAHDPFGELELGGRKIAWVHGHRPGVLRELIAAGKFDYVFHGHTHVVRREQFGPTLVVNPGAFTRVAQKTCLLVDLAVPRLEPVLVG